MLVDWASAVDASMKAVACAKCRKEGTFGENFRGRSGHEQFVSIQRVYHLASVERIKLDAEVSVSKFGAADDLLNAFSETGLGLCAGWP